MKNAVLEKIEGKYLKKDTPRYNVGDTLRIGLKIIEGNKERIQHFEGTLIKIKGSGINKSLTIRKISSGVGVEKTFMIHSPQVASITVSFEGKVRRSKLYYLRDRIGSKAIRIKPRDIEMVQKTGTGEKNS